MDEDGVTTDRGDDHGAVTQRGEERGGRRASLWEERREGVKKQ